MSKITFLIIAFFFAHSMVAAQKTGSSAKSEPKPIIFAVLYDGEGIEPIASIQGGKLISPPAMGESDSATLKSFSSVYYKAKTKYDLIFGGRPSGEILINSSNPSSDCGKSRAAITVRSPRAVKGFVMALATNAKVKTQKAGVRRLPTAVERSEIETLVRAEFARQNVSAAALKLRYHNLTALDVDSDGKAEIVGSYWIAPKATERNLLFLIAEKGSSGKYSLTHVSHEEFTPDKIMSGEAKDLDDGIYHELLLDVFDYDSDGVSEIFTIGRAFEGNNFYAYKREAGKWIKAFETYNYHCAY